MALLEGADGRTRVRPEDSIGGDSQPLLQPHHRRPAAPDAQELDANLGGSRSSRATVGSDGRRERGRHGRDDERGTGDPRLRERPGLGGESLRPRPRLGDVPDIEIREIPVGSHPAKAA